MNVKPSMNWLRRLPASSKYFLAVGITVVAVVCGVGTAWSVGAFSPADTSKAADYKTCPSGTHHEGNLAGSCVGDKDANGNGLDMNVDGDPDFDSQTPSTEEVPDVSEVPDPTKKDFTVEAKVKSKHCFGSAGCSVEVEPELTFVGDDFPTDDRTCEVTIQITGDESGPTIETAEMDSGANYTVDTASLDTSSNSTPIGASVQDVSCSMEFGD